jgi:hypothetical protein
LKEIGGKWSDKKGEWYEEKTRRESWNEQEFSKAWRMNEREVVNKLKGERARKKLGNSSFEKFKGKQIQRIYCKNWLKMGKTSKQTLTK